MYILRLFILQPTQIQGVQFKITTIEIFPKRRLSLKNEFQMKVVQFEGEKIMVNSFLEKIDFLRSHGNHCYLFK